MATVQHLEKLYEILRVFETSETLEATVASERVTQLISKTEKLLYQRSFLRDERRRLRIFTEQIEDKEKGLKLMKRMDWIPENMKATMNEEAHLLINIGGLMFESPKSILLRDAGSLLAQLCGPDPPLLPDPEGFFFFDRDWWLFRYILNFLRDGVLPDDRVLLAQLYKEASFWNLKELQKAIEETKLHLIPEPSKDKEKLEKEKKLWWRQLPNWWQAVDEANEKKKKEEEEKKKKANDWWTSTTYNGKPFLPLSKASEKLIAKVGEKDELPMTKTTWSTRDISQQIEDMQYDHNTWYAPTYRHLKIGEPLRNSGEYPLPSMPSVGFNEGKRNIAFSLPDSKDRMGEIREKYAV